MEGIIFLKDVIIYGNHGCFEEERITGGYYRANLRVYCDISNCMVSDRLSDAVNYMEIHKILEEEVRKSSNLLENVCWRVLCRIKKELNGVNKVWVCIEKRRPPMGGEVSWSGVEIEG